MTVTKFSSEKIPIFPLLYQKRNRFPDYEEDWWFYRCAEGPAMYGYGVEYWNTFYVTALEDSTEIIKFDYSNIFSSGCVPDTNSFFLQKGVAGYDPDAKS